VERGRRLFFDARLSHDRWLSCHSCHTDASTGGLLADTLGDGTFGTPKRIPGLFGVGATAPWAWDGSVERLEDQVRKSIVSTMQGDPPTDEQVADLTAFLRSLPPPDPAGRSSGAASERGRAVFEARKCDRCHAPPEYTSPGLFDVGLADEAGRRAFNPPSLRGVGSLAPLLHDGRAASLTDLFGRLGHPRNAVLASPALDDLVAFLRGL
jgi:cytochrome c peroxidase